MPDAAPESAGGHPPGAAVQCGSEPPILYTQTGCVDSGRVRSWLVEHGIPFTERNVTGNPEVAQALYQTGLFGTPLLVAGERKVFGFHPAHLAAFFDDETDP